MFTATRTQFCVSLSLFLVALSLAATVRAGEPPFPNELLYPNIVPPKYEFGTYGHNPGQFADPSTAAIGADGLLYVVDSSNNRIQVLQLNGEVVRTWGRLGSDKGELVRPEGIAIDQETIAVSDTGNNRITLYSPRGEVFSCFGQFGTEDGKLSGPQGLAIDSSRVYVADVGNDRVQVFERSGKHLFTIGKYGIEQGRFNRPTDVAVDPDGNIYVADSRNNRIQKFSSNGEYIKSWGQWGSHQGLFATPCSIKVVGDRVYVSDLTNHRIQVFDRNGSFILQWARHPPNAHEGRGRVHYPTGLAVSQDGSTTVVCEPIENRIQVFSKQDLQKVKRLNDSAWWDKATRFHYGSRTSVAGNLLAVSEPDTHSVIMFDIAGDSPKFIARLGGQGNSLGRFVEPTGMTIDPEHGLIHVSDGGNLRTQLFRLARVGSSTQFLQDATAVINSRTFRLSPALPALSIVDSAKNSFTDVIRPGAIARDIQGNTHLVDQAFSRVMVFDKDNSFKFAFGSYGAKEGQLRGAFNISFSKNNDKVFVVDSYNFRVSIFDKAGKYLGKFGAPGLDDGQFIHPFGIASGTDGFVYVTDAASHVIQKFDEDGKFVKKWGKWGTKEGEFYKPKGVSQDDRGRLYVLDFGNHRGQVFDGDGKFLTTFGMNEFYRPPQALRGPMQPAMATGKAAISSSASATPPSPRPGIRLGMLKQANGELFGPSNGSSYHVVITPALIQVNKPMTLSVSVFLDAERKIREQDIDIAFDAVMPAHYHGFVKQPTVTKQGDGSFKVDNVLFHMPGHWEAYVDVAKGDLVERTQVDLDIE